MVLDADHAAVDLKDKMIAYMKEKGYECVDYGTNYDENGEIIKCDYPKKGMEVGEAVVNGDVDYGVFKVWNRNRYFNGC